MSDLIERVRRQWTDVRPDLDTSAIAVIGRVLRLASLVRKESDDLLSAHDLNRPEFDVLAALRRCETLTPGQLRREMLASGAAVTKRVERLRKLGLVTRRTSDRDRRVAHLALTPRGRSLIDSLLPRQLALEEVALARLTSRQRTDLAHLLSLTIETLEGHTPD